MSKRLFLSIGECMIEMSPAEGDNYLLGYAGDTLNTAWYTRARLSDAWEVAYLSRLGADPHSARLRGFLEANGISTRMISTDPQRIPGLYVIDVHKGERSFTYWRENSAAKHLADDEAMLAAALQTAEVIYFSAITLAILAPDRRDFLIRQLGQARAAGKLTIFDTNIRPKLWDNLDSLREVTMRAAAVSEIVLPSFEDEQKIFGDASPEATLSRYSGAGARVVVVKNGGGPIHARNGDLDIPARDYGQVEMIDSTGAGDSFNGGLIAALLSGQDLGSAIATAHVLACQVIRTRGALMPMKSISAG